MMKRLLVILLAVCLVCLAQPVTTTAAGDASAFSMPSFLTTGMLFQQNKPMTLWGKAVPGDRIEAQLYRDDEAYPQLETVNTVTGSGGEWELSFTPRAGSYDSYAIEIYCNDMGVRMFTDILIGELWLTTGQSNMEFALHYAVGGAEAIETADDPYLRVLVEPNTPQGYDKNYPAEPMFDVTGCRWARGDIGAALSNVSAIGYEAAVKLRRQLDLPVGFIHAARGATNIQTWISRQSIENDQTLVEYLQSARVYRTAAEMQDTANDANTLTALYNTKIAPLSRLHIAGVMWYQGETNRDGQPNAPGYYTAALQALVGCFADTFGFESSAELPFFISHLAAHNYLSDPFNLAYWVEDVTAACQAMPNIVQLPLYDAPLTYRDPPETWYYPIHPSDKRIIGQRMAQAALQNVYGKGGSRYAPATFRSVSFGGGHALVTFDNVGDGLLSRRTLADVQGFALCGSDRIFVPAHARVVSSDTVDVWCDGLTDPVAVTYAFASFNNHASLFNSQGLPAVPFRSDAVASQYLAPNDWMSADSLTDWYSDNSTAGEQDCWLVAPLSGSDKATLSLSDDHVEGKAALCLTYEESTGVGPLLNAYLRPFRLGRYTTLSVMVKNPDAREKTVSLLLGGRKNGQRYSAATAEGKPAYTLMPGGGYQRLTFRLDQVTDLKTGESVVLTSSQSLELQFSITDTAAGSLLLDDITLGFDNPSTVTFDPSYRYAYGDLDGNGQINATDALLTLQHSVRLTELDAKSRALADVDANVRINAADALLILQSSVKLIDPSAFPAAF